MYDWRSAVRREKLVLAKKVRVTSEEYETMKKKVEQCREWEQLIGGWREGLDWSSWGEEKVEERLETEAGLAGEGHHPLEGGVEELLTCSHCRTTLSNGWSKARHR